ncbi:hypothetical protein JCGZ_17245 [Jatropha curcas]|uniref:Uncharacterized protein n=1 Tax=Jatropha curcas TaxID=180498 RepID=A0A067LEH4_JATCU|nr:hypothetical protein JCGZ_17245 [Jatropha curcas]
MPKMDSLVNFELNDVIVANFWERMIFRPPCTAAGGSGPVTGRRHSGEAPRDRMLFSLR